MNKQDKPFYEKFVRTNNANKRKQNNQEKKKADRLEKNILKKEPFLPYSKVKIKDISLFAPFDKEAVHLLQAFDEIAKDALGFTKKYESTLLKEIRILFHELTDDRNSRKVHYLNDPVKLTAYIFYYMWWNLVRISKLIKNMEFDLKDGSVIADLGSGPFTLICDFWIAKPELRKKKLTWYCIDISSKALSAGEKIFHSLYKYSEKTVCACNWQTVKVKGGMGTALKDEIDLFLSANMFNEIFYDSPLTLLKNAEKTAKGILNYTKKKASVFLIEPGIPFAGTFLSEMRAVFLKNGYYVKSPCPHNGVCPIPGISGGKKGYDFSEKSIPAARGKWCHFSFLSKGIPSNLESISQSVKLEKERAALSFLYCTPSNTLFENTHTNKTQNTFFDVRIASNLIKLYGGFIGRYACSEKGFLLIKEKDSQEAKLKKLSNGALLRLEIKIGLSFRDKKSGAILVQI